MPRRLQRAASSACSLHHASIAASTAFDSSSCWPTVQHRSQIGSPSMLSKIGRPHCLQFISNAPVLKSSSMWGMVSSHSLTNISSILAHQLKAALRVVQAAALVDGALYLCVGVGAIPGREPL